MTRHSRAWHQMHDAALDERQEVRALHMPAFAILTSLPERLGAPERVTHLQDDETERPMNWKEIARREGLPVDSVLDNLADMDRHSRRAMRSIHGHQTGNYDD